MYANIVLEKVFYTMKPGVVPRGADQMILAPPDFKSFLRP